MDWRPFKERRVATEVKTRKQLTSTEKRGLSPTYMPCEKASERFVSIYLLSEFHTSKRFTKCWTGYEYELLKDVDTANITYIFNRKVVIFAFNH